MIIKEIDPVVQHLPFALNDIHSGLWKNLYGIAIDGCIDNQSVTLCCRWHTIHLNLIL